MLPPARGGPRPAQAGGKRPRTRIMDSDFKLGFKFRVTVTVTARFKFLRVSRDGHAGTSLRVRGLDSLAEAAWIPGQSPALY